MPNDKTDWTTCCLFVFLLLHYWTTHANILFLNSSRENVKSELTDYLLWRYFKAVYKKQWVYFLNSHVNYEKLQFCFFFCAHIAFSLCIITNTRFKLHWSVRANETKATFLYKNHLPPGQQSRPLNRYKNYFLSQPLLLCKYWTQQYSTVKEKQLLMQGRTNVNKT